MLWLKRFQDNLLISPLSPSKNTKREQGLYEFKKIKEEDGREIDVIHKVDTLIDILIKEEG